MTERAREALLLVGLTAGALALRVLGLAEGDFWVDELVTRRVVDRAPSDVLITVQENELTPHLYYLLAWAWSGILGTGEAGIRSLSVVAGVAVVPISYLTLRQVHLRREGLIAAALTAVSPILVWYSQEARVYSLFALLTAVSLLFFVRALVTFDRRALVGWSAASAAALVTHYFAAFTIAGMAAVLLYRHRARWQAIALSLLPTAAAGFGLLPIVAVQRDLGGQGWIGEIPFKERLLQLPEHFLTGFNYPPLPVVLGAGLLAVAGLVGLLLHDKRGQLVGGTLLAVAGASIALPMLLIAANADLLNSRNVLGALLPLLLAISVGLGAARLRVLTPILAFVLVGLLACVTVAGEYDDEVERPAWDAAADAVSQGGDPDLVIACCGVVALPAENYFGQFETYDPPVPRDVEITNVVLAAIRRPDHRPENDFCWWGGACQGTPGGVPGPPPPGSISALSRTFASVFDRVDTFTRGAITLERYQSATPFTLGDRRTHFRLRSRTTSLFPTFTAIVGNNLRIPGVVVLIRESGGDA